MVQHLIVFLFHSLLFLMSLCPVLKHLCHLEFFKSFYYFQCYCGVISCPIFPFCVILVLIVCIVEYSLLMIFLSRSVSFGVFLFMIFFSIWSCSSTKVSPIIKLDCQDYVRYTASCSFYMSCFCLFLAILQLVFVASIAILMPLLDYLMLLW